MTWTPPWRASTPPAVVSRQNPHHYSRMDSRVLHTTTNTITIITTCSTTSQDTATNQRGWATSPQSCTPPRLRTPLRRASDARSPCTSSPSGTCLSDKCIIVYLLKFSTRYLPVQQIQATKPSVNPRGRCRDGSGNGWEFIRGSKQHELHKHHHLFICDKNKENTTAWKKHGSFGMINGLCAPAAVQTHTRIYGVSLSAWTLSGFRNAARYFFPSVHWEREKRGSLYIPARSPDNWA